MGLNIWGYAADFIYSEYLTTVPAAFRNMTWQVAADYAKADLLLRLPGYCPMPAFKEMVDVPLVVRHAQRPVDEVRSPGCAAWVPFAQQSKEASCGAGHLEDPLEFLGWIFDSLRGQA